MKRYERQIVMPEIGISGQKKLAEARVLIIGVGGLGCPVLQNLAGAGVGTIGLVDGDVVDETNLHRQFLYSLNDCGRNKVEVAAEVTLKQNPEVSIIRYSEYFAKQNCLEIVSDYQIIIDCTDNIPTRYLINDVAVAKGIPMVYASIHKFEGQLSVFNYKNGPTYRCLFPEDDRLEVIPNCNDSGVLGVLPNVLGTLQANEVLKIILEIGEVLSGELLLYNSLDNSFQTIKIQKDTNLINENNFINKSISITDFFTNDDSLIIDIREEYEEPKLDLETIKNVPLSQLDNFLKDVDSNQKIILVCQHGNRSELAVEYLIKKGFINVFHLQNGIESLERINNDNR
ncbi:HesA/MoeB/ThiF family protein [Flavobacterium sangjuense]|uniref:Molybdopterin-synthase adenylyltransferase n=1 Tax=Flavobacterium sangjuense TaxID=2518177 RepID=A0A4P7PSX5_9FLAO|nr:HesA/MoeB/ThiF family protein [Flavobacterium sangjuense]QBZ97969.1 putative adenylyltransferase/sulfurtransferase MoeZ [Flavobacterium sangjuense]